MMKSLRALASPWSVAVAFVLFFALFTRLYHLGITPAGMSWDEAALGYIGRMTVTTRRDEHGQFLPLTFTSFGDYKAPLAMYVTGVFTTIFGLYPWVVRLPFALAGVGSVILLLRLGDRLFRNRWFGLLAGWLLVITPWHLLFSRVAFESGLALFFYLMSLTAWLEIREQKTINTFWLGAGGAGIIGALYAYHSAKIVLPLAIVTIVWHEWQRNRQWLRQNQRLLTTAAAVVVAACSPVAINLLFGNGGQRAQQTLVMASQPLWMALGSVIKGFIAHLSLQFLVFGQTDTLRHGTNLWGQLSFSQLALLLIGISYLVSRLLSHWSFGRKIPVWRWLVELSQKVQPDRNPSPWLWFWLAAIGIFPAALGFEIPHANRALLALPPIILLMTWGVSELRRDVTPLLFSSIFGVLLLLAGLEFARFWQLYHGSYRARSSADWLQGYQQAVRLTDSYRQEGKTIKFTSAYGEPEIFFGFTLGIPADIYRQRRVPQVTFGGIEPSDPQNFDMVVTSPGESLPQLPTYVISRADGQPAFLLYETR